MSRLLSALVGIALFSGVANGQEAQPGSDAALTAHVGNLLRSEDIKRALDVADGKSMSIADGEALQKWNALDKSAIQPWNKGPLQQIVNLGSPAPAVNGQSPNGVLTFTCPGDALMPSEAGAAKFALAQASDLHAVAVLEIKSPTDAEFSIVATAFLLSSEWIATNYHVAATFSDGNYPTSHIKKGLQVALVFGEDPAVGTNKKVLIPDSAVIYGSPDPDVVVFRVPGIQGIAAPRQLGATGDQLRVSEQVAVVGFPQRTGEESTDSMDQVFGICGRPNPPVLMRIAIGTVAKVGASLGYTANTLASNSGSPIFRVSDGLLVGMHSGYGGNSLINDGVPLAAVNAVLSAAASAP